MKATETYVIPAGMLEALTADTDSLDFCELQDLNTFRGGLPLGGSWEVVDGPDWEWSNDVDGESGLAYELDYTYDDSGAAVAS